MLYPKFILWLKTGKYWYLATSLSLISVTVTSHHVTPIFGMIFFIFPLIGLVIMDASKEEVKTMKAVNFKVFLKYFAKLFKRMISFWWFIFSNYHWLFITVLDQL